MKRLALVTFVLAAGCGESAPSSAKAPPAPGPEPVSQAPPKADAEALLASAERERSGALYEQAMKAFDAALEADPKNAAAREGRALARWRLSLMRGTTDPEVAKDLEAAGDRPRARALKALARLVDEARTGGGWGHLPEAILKQVIAKAFPESEAVSSSTLKHPQEVERIIQDLAAAPDWPLAAGVKAALEGHDVPAPGKEGILWIFAALRLPQAEGLKSLESAEGPDQGILMQAQAQFLAAERRFNDATGRMSIAPLPVLRAAANVAWGKPAPALESLGTDDASAFARAIRAAALMQTGTDSAIGEMDKLVDSISIPWFRVERGIRRLAKGSLEGALSDLKGSRQYPMALWHAQDFDGAARELGALAERTALIEETLGYVLQAKGEQEAGAARLVASLEKAPTRENFFRLARHLRGDRQWEALQKLGHVLAKAVPTEPEAWAAQAEAAFWLKAYDASFAWATAALEQKVDPKKLLKWRALSYEELGKFTEAHEDWSRLAEIDPQQGEALAHRAWMRAKLGRWADVRRDAEQGISRTSDAWASALARFAIAAEELHGPPPEGETIEPDARKEGAVKHLLLAAKTGAVEESDLDKIRAMFASVGAEEWKKVADAAAEKRKELTDDAKRGSMLGVMADHGGGSVMVTGTYRKSGARQAGLAPGDIILEVDGRRVIHVGDVGSIISGREAGTKVKVKIERELRPKLKLVQVREVTLTRRDIFGD